MEEGMWYSADELMTILELKKTRTKELLRNLVKDDILEDDNATKGRKYKKK